MNELSDSRILLPVIVLTAWTFIVLMQIPLRRFRAVRNGESSQEDFALGESRNVPDHVALANRNYMNLLELPVLFYLGCLIYYVLQVTSGAILGLAWLYVGLRIIHSLIHLTYNDVKHRLIVFGLSNLSLLVIWLLLVDPILGA